MKKTLLSILISGAALAPGYSAVIASWDLTGRGGTDSTIAGTTALPEISAVADLSRGSGVVAGTGWNHSYGAKWWEAGPAANPADDTDYIQFGFTVASGMTIDLTNLVIGTRVTSTGPGTVGLFYSGNSYATPLYSFVHTAASSDIPWTVDLASLPDLSAGQVTFRLIQIDNNRQSSSSAPSAPGMFWVVENGTSDVAFNGTVVAVPEPSAALLGGLGILALLRRRRH